MNNKRKIRYSLIYLVLAIGAVIFVFPYLYMMIASTQTNAEILSLKLNLKPNKFFWPNLLEVQEKYQYSRAMINTIYVSIIGTVLSTIITTLAGYTFAKYDFKYKKGLFNLVLVSRMVPVFTTLIPTYYIFSKIGLTNTHAGIIISGLASSTSVFVMTQYAKSFPTELMDAARIDGASESYIFWNVAVPVLKPAIITSALLTFMGYWNSYLFPLVMLSDAEKFTVPLVIQNITQNTYEPLNHGALMALLATSVIPIILIYFIIQSRFESTDVDASIK